MSLLIAVAIAALVACGGESSEAGPATTPSTALQMAFSVSDLSVGTNRIAFGLLEAGLGPVRGAVVQVSTFFLTEETQEGPLETVSAVFRPWPVGAGGVYTAQVTFDRPGTWGLGAIVVNSDGSVRESSARVEVAQESFAPQIGSKAPRSVTKTARDVGKLEEITTDPDPDPDLYTLTIAEALDAGRPLVVAFSTPAYCTTATCGPQLDVVKELKRQHGDRINFIHVEIYDNPLEIQGDLNRGRLADAVTEWNLRSEPWTFIMDGIGIVIGRFEGFTTQEELEAALAAVIE